MNPGGTTTRTPRDRRLTLASQLIGYLAGEYPNAARRISDVLASQPWPADTLAGSTSGGDISDPTGNTATQQWLGILDEMDRCANAILTNANRLDDLVKRTPTMVNLELIKRQSRCTGGKSEKGSEVWGRPECQNIVGERSQTGLCDACYQRRHHWLTNERKRIEGAA